MLTKPGNRAEDDRKEEFDEMGERSQRADYENGLPAQI